MGALTSIVIMFVLLNFVSASFHVLIIFLKRILDYPIVLVFILASNYGDSFVLCFSSSDYIRQAGAVTHSKAQCKVPYGISCFGLKSCVWHFFVY